jgi:FkbM family methyltransferase
MMLHPQPVRAIVEEVFSVGQYPRSVELRTPTGRCDIQLYSPADLSTLNLIFCRQDYYTPKNLSVVVDIGSNIGISALYWLSRNNGSIVYCYEPAPISYERLLSNLHPYGRRIVPHRLAVSDFSGTASLGLEESGVYSSLDLRTSNHVECQVVHINDLLETVLTKHGQIDVLKIDSEGHELQTIMAISPQFWKRIRCLNTDCKGASQFVPEDFHYSSVSSAERFTR